jgi:hypothetical protein
MSAVHLSPDRFFALPLHKICSVSPNLKELYQDSDKKWESLLRISEEAQTAKNIEHFVATIHEILADLVVASNFFICLYEKSSGKYFFPISWMNTTASKPPG